VNVRVMRLADRWLTVAELAGKPEVGLGPSRAVAVLFALWPLGEQLARQFAASITG